PKIDNKDHFELKGQFLKELRDNTFSGSDHEDANEHIETVLEIVDLFHIHNITQDQVMLRVFPIKYCPPARTAKKIEEINNFQQEPDETLYQAWERFKELLMKCPQHYLTKMQEVILFYNALEVPARKILDSKGVIPTKTAADAKDERNVRAAASGFYKRNNANPSYQERRQLMKESLRKFMSESTKRHEENSNLIKEIPASTNAAIINQGASIKTLEIQIWQMSKVLQERGFRGLPSSTETNPRDHFKSTSTTVEADTTLIRRIGSP
ncbi:zf-CCHC domain-containing protein, partial [Tanacetum coccineum]